jgi:hypothetical protein
LLPPLGLPVGWLFVCRKLCQKGGAGDIFTGVIWGFIWKGDDTHHTA